MRTDRKIVLLLLLLFCFSASCRRKHHNTTRGFYYWKTVYKPTSFEINTLHKLDVRRMYIRLFDVDYDDNLKHTVPVAPVRMGSIDTGFTYIPVVFITQKAIVSLNDKDVKQMAENICSFAQFLATQAGIKTTELQIDCDWTAGTKNKYFTLLKAIKQQPFMQDKLLSCTIRLNQVKYQSYNGIPPADRGLVMCYGMGNLKKNGPLNSILDAGETEDYLAHMNTYPLPLDVALPVFEWCILFRDEKFIGILHEMPTDAVKTSNVFKQKDRNLYTCLYDTIWQGYQLRKNDMIRLEKPVYNDILSVANYASQQISNKDVNVIFFDCDSITLSKFSTDELEAIYARYR